MSHSHRLTLVLLFFLTIGSLSTLAQGTVRGKVTDEFGETVPFVNIYLRDMSQNGTASDFNGLYSLSIPDSNPHQIVFSAIGKAEQVFDITLKDKEVLVLNVTIEDVVVQIGEGVEIVAKANKTRDNYMERVKLNSANAIDYISAQTIGKTGDSNVPDAIKRITGVSTVGGYVSVRGLADRYIKTTLNGMRLPTLDPFTNNIRTDLFPTGMIDNIIITKTMTPDLPGDWSGAYISIETKDFPEELKLSVNTTIGYNDQSTFKDVVSSNRGDSEWLGFDDGYRDIPEGVPTVQSQFPNIINPSLWQQFSYLGLTDELAQYGINSSTPITNGSIYHQVALAELGFLGPAQFNNNAAVQTAITDYNSTYSQGLFFTAYNQNLETIGQSFNNDWFTTRRTAPFNFSQNFSIGNQTKLFNKALGYIFGFRYESSVQYDPESVLQRTSLPESAQDNGRLANLRDYAQEVSRETNGWSALLDLSYKLNQNNTVSLMVMPSFRGQGRARKYNGIREDIFEPTYGDDQIYEERQQFVYQLETEHFLPSSKIRIDFDASYTDGQRNVLDFKDVRYLFDPTINQFLFNSTFNPDRRFRFMDEDLFDSRVSIEIPILSDRVKPTKLKFGGAYQYNTRSNQQVVYTLVGLNEEDLLLGFDQVFAPSRFLISDSTNFDLIYNNSSTFDDSDIGFSTILGGYGMADFSFSERLRLVGGARVEHTDLFVDIRELYDNDIPLDDERRFNGNGQLLNPGEIIQTNVLPSINLIYNLASDDKLTCNLRANYNRSLARPSFRELTALSQFDYELIARVRGNTELEMTDINNYDLRLESYFKSGANLSVSAFYKTFRNHIELIQAEGAVFTWQNADFSDIVGVEIEGKKNLTQKLELRANITFIQSRTTITIPVKETRQMFGQAPYIFNGILSYNLDSLGMVITGSYNVQGPRLAVVSSTGVAAPDVFEMPRHMIDCKVSKTLGEHFNLGLAVRNLLNAPLRRAYKFDEGFILDFDSFRFGTTYNLSLTYNL